MTASTTPHPPTIDAWLDGLTGQPPGAGTHPATREGDMIRQLLAAQAAQLQAQAQAQPDPAQAEAHWAGVLQRVRAAQSLPMAAPRPTSTGWLQAALHALGRWASPQGGMALAAVAVLGLAAALVLRPGAPVEADEEPTLFRGDEAVTRLTVPASALEPTLRRITTVLEQHQVAYLLKRLNHGAQVQAKLVPGSPAAQALLALNIRVPAHGRVNLLVATN